MSNKTLASCAWYRPEVRGQPPCPRQGHAIATIDETVYLFGGSSATEDGRKFKFHNDLYKLEVEKDTVRWQEVKQEGLIPKPRDGHSLCAVGDKIYLYGGKNCLLARQCKPRLYALDTGGERCVWSEVSTTGTAPLTLGHTLSHVGSALYVVGGLLDSVATNDVWMLHLELHTWVPLRVSGPRPPPRCDHAAAVVESQIYLFGGCGAEDVYYNDLFVLDTRSLTWETPKVKGTAPSPRAGHTFVVHRTKDIYVLGGTTDTMKNEMTMFADLVKLSLARPRWKWPLFTGTCVEGRYGHTAAVIHSQLYVMAGLGRTGQFNDVRALRLINPSDRQPAVAPLLGPLRDAGYQPTKPPRLCYDVTGTVDVTTGEMTKGIGHCVDDSGDSASTEDDVYRKDRATPIQTIKDLRNLKKQTSETIEKALTDLTERYEDLFKQEHRLERSRERLQEDRAAYEDVYLTQRQDLAELVSRHRAQTETWLQTRQAENDEQRRNIAEQKVVLREEQRLVELERADLKERAEQLRCVARQLSHS